MSIKAVAYALHESPYAGKKQLVHIAIADVVNNDTMVGFISQESIARAAKCSIEFVRLTVREMIGNGHLEIVQEARQHLATVYRMVLPDASQPPTELGSERPQPPTPAPNSDGAEESQPPTLTAQPPTLTAQPPTLIGDFRPIHPSLSSKDKSGAAKPPKARKRATPAPDSLPITEAMREWAAKTVPQVDTGDETEKFLDYCRANGRCFIDWTSAWRNWMRRAPQFGPQAKPVRNPDTYVADMNQRIAHRRAAEDGAAAKLREIL